MKNKKLPNKSFTKKNTLKSTSPNWLPKSLANADAESRWIEFNSVDN